MSEDVNGNYGSQAEQPSEPPDWLKRFSQFLETPKKPLPSNIKRLGEELLMQARADLREFRRKYDSKDYPRSIFWLQQSAEKATKGLFVLLGLIHPDDLQRKIGHLTPLAFLQIIESDEFGWIPDFVEWLEGLAVTKGINLSFDVREVRQIIRQNRREIAKLTPTQVDSLIQFAQSFRTQLLPLINIRWKLYRLSATAEHKELIAKGNTKGLGKAVVATLRLYIIALVTFPHWDTTRYPSEGFSPIIYTPELGVVAKATTLASMLVASLRELESYTC